MWFASDIATALYWTGLDPFPLPCTVLSSRIVRLRSGSRLVVNHLSHDGKHLPKATSSLGDPLMRIFLRSKAHSRLRSFARNPSHVSLSAVTRRSASP